MELKKKLFYLENQLNEVLSEIRKIKTEEVSLENLDNRRRNFIRERGQEPEYLVMSTESLGYLKNILNGWCKTDASKVQSICDGHKILVDDSLVGFKWVG